MHIALEHIFSPTIDSIIIIIFCIVALAIIVRMCINMEKANKQHGQPSLKELNQLYKKRKEYLKTHPEENN